MSRSIKPDGKKIKTLRMAKAWSTLELGTRSKCSPKTVENIEAGKCVYLATLSNVATALGVGVPEIATDAGELAAKQDGVRHFKVDLKLNMPFNDCDQSEQLVSFIEMLQFMLPGGGGSDDRIDLLAVSDEDGSDITVSVSMSEKRVAEFMKMIPSILKTARETKKRIRLFISGHAYFEEPGYFPIARKMLRQLLEIHLPTTEDYTNTELRGRVYCYEPLQANQPEETEDPKTTEGQLLQGGSFVEQVHRDIYEALSRETASAEETQGPLGGEADCNKSERGGSGKAWWRRLMQFFNKNKA